MPNFKSAQKSSAISTNNAHPFTVYAASAGSGKTYALVKNYLLKVLSTKQSDNYKSLLAITFTNKAVAEMKTRILKQLQHYGDYAPGDKLADMQYELCEALNLNPEVLAAKSKRVLKDILHNYGSFAVETIDSFNHRIIRTFARDLGLRTDFEVTTETDLLLQQAVDRVLSKTGQDEYLTQTLVAFAVQKTEEDRSWDPTRELLEKARVLLEEQSLEPLENLKDKTTEDFKSLTKTVKSKREQAGDELVKLAQQALDLITSSGLEVENFNRGMYPKHMQALLEGGNPKWENKWQLNIEETPLYTKSQKPEIKAIIDGIHHELVRLFIESKQKWLQADWYARLYREIVPFTVLNYIRKEYRDIKEEQNLVTVSEFNKRIYEQVKAQPVPFIYERMGEKYRHFFVDEFQDTSMLQWQNLFPLVDNALTQQDATGQQGSLLVVGDAKQSIYRWRGGLPEQFINLSHKKSPFAIASDLKQLTKNYRSYSKIIEFNNGLFEHLGSFLEEGLYRDCYTKESAQQINDRLGGYVTVEFFEGKTRADREPEYLKRIKEKIEQCLAQNYSYKDICVLTRKKEDSKIIAQALGQDFPVVSPDSLLLKESALVRFFISSLNWANRSSDREAQLEFLWSYFKAVDYSEELHPLFDMGISGENANIRSVFDQLGVDFSVSRFNGYGVYEALEYLIRSFKLQDRITAYERHFLDLARSFQQQHNASVLSFLEAWEQQEDSAALQFPDTLNAIRLMTVHKAKGLEFPVVIVPFTDSDLINIRNERLWYRVDPEQYCGFHEFHLPLSAIKHIDSQRYEACIRQRFFDELNVWYVALTRAEEQLFVISSAQKPGSKTFGGLLRVYLQQLPEPVGGPDLFESGKPLVKPIKPEAEFLASSDFISAHKSDNKIRLVASPSDKYERENRAAQERGNRLHLWLSQLENSEDLDILFNQLQVLARHDAALLKKDRQLLESVVNHPQLASYFKVGISARNEAALIDEQGQLHRPDRLVFHQKEVTIIDYKFGSPDESYKPQLDRYQSVLKSMGYTTVNKILVYVTDKIQLETW